MKSIRLFTALMFITGLALAVRAAPMAQAGLIHVDVNEEVGSHAHQVTTGTITIVKEAPLADPNHEFQFIEIDMPGFSLTPGSSKDFTNLTPGYYGFAEDARSFPDSSWTLTGVICQDEEGEQFYPEMFDGGDIFYFIGANIRVEAGQHLTCVFTNEPRGTITIVKEAPLADPNHEFRFIEIDMPGFSLTPGSSKDFTNLTPGYYYYFAEDAESFPDNSWTLTGVMCQDEEGEQFYPSIDDGGDIFYFIGANIPLEAGQHLTCVFTNEPTSSITIVKDADPAEGQEFFFSGDLGDFSLPGDGAHSEDYLLPDNYTIAENVPSGWGLQDVWCHIADIPEEGADFDFDPSTNSATVRLAPGQDVVCTFFNETVNTINLPYILKLVDKL